MNTSASASALFANSAFVKSPNSYVSLPVTKHREVRHDMHLPVTLVIAPCALDNNHLVPSPKRYPDIANRRPRIREQPPPASSALGSDMGHREVYSPAQCMVVLRAV